MNMETIKYHAGRFWLAVSLSFIVFTPYISRYASTFNRYIFHWNKYDTAVLILCVLSTAIVFYIIFLALYIKGSNHAKKTCDFLFISLTSLTGISCLTQTIAHYLKKLHLTLGPPTPAIKIFFIVHFPHLLSILWICFIILVWRKNCFHLKKLFIRLCFIVSPVIPIFFFNTINYHAWLTQTGNLKHTISSTIRSRHLPDIFIFIFDEWSYQRSFKGKKIIPELGNMKTFKENSTVFHNAFSPAPNTFTSIPAMLFQTNNHFRVKDGIPGFTGKEFKPASSYKSIFQHPNSLGYHTCITGSYIPYASLLENKVDFAFSMSVSKRFGCDFFDVAAYHFFKAATVLAPQLLSWPLSRCDNYFYNMLQVRRITTEDIFLKSITQGVATPVYSVFHYMLPHFPYIFDKNGSKPLFARYPWKPANYMGNLYYMDKKAGWIIKTLKKTGRFDSSLIVFTSDHTWRKDPKTKGGTNFMEKCHIPLFIKLPYQKVPIEINSKFSTSMLGILINGFLDNKITSNNIQTILKNPVFFKTPLKR